MNNSTGHTQVIFIVGFKCIFVVLTMIMAMFLVTIALMPF
jgi:hypothetical protein